MSTALNQFTGELDILGLGTGAGNDLQAVTNNGATTTNQITIDVPSTGPALIVDSNSTAGFADTLEFRVDGTTQLFYGEAFGFYGFVQPISTSSLFFGFADVSNFFLINGATDTISIFAGAYVDCNQLRASTYLEIADGAYNAPSFRLQNGTTTGMWKYGTNQIGWSFGGSPGFYFDVITIGFSNNTSIDYSTNKQFAISVQGNPCLTVTGGTLILGSGGGGSEPQIDFSISGQLHFAVTPIYADNSAYVNAGTGGSYAVVGGGIFNSCTDVGNTTTTETDLATDTTSANIFISTNDKITAFYSINIIGHATATRRIRVYFAGTAYFDSGNLACVTNDNWQIKVELVRTGTTTARMSVMMNTTNAAKTCYTSENDITSLTFTNTNILKVTGTAAGVGAATNDMVHKHHYVKYLQTS